MTQPQRRGVGNAVAPPRFLLFLLVLTVGVPGALRFFPSEDWQLALLTAFDTAALCFLLAAVTLLRKSDADEMRRHAAANDANRLSLLIITVAVSASILVTVASLLSLAGKPALGVGSLIIASLALTWLFANTIFAMHYAHLYYLPDGGRDRAGLEFPGDDTPDYWDFLYFSFTLGMTFQTSDVTVASGHMRRIVLLQSIAAFVFNIGILAFVINTLGGAH